MSKPRNQGRNINGILLLDKPIGMSSNAALQKVKHLFKARKAGHTGSLDPLASGMLPICFGEATKFCQFLLDADKHYIVTAKLGEKTTTGDAEGEVIAKRAVPEITNENLLALFEKFTGTVEQIPSMYSALKHNGQPLYKLARQGIEVKRESRKITIYSLTLLNQETDNFSFEVHCSKGTYVRTLVEDMGEILGCGAYVANLRRSGAGPYQASQMHTLSSLETIEDLDSLLLPVDSSVTVWPDVRLPAAAAYYLQQGQPVMIPHAPTQGWVRLTSNTGNFLGVGEIMADGRVAPRRLVQL
jgi:tRNA pseudouridine55 synthase